MIDSETVVGTGLRITVAKDELAAKLAVVARGVSSRTTVLVLGGIQLRAEGNQLHLAATDMEVSLRASVEAQVADEGTVVVPGPPAARHRALAVRTARSRLEHHPDEAVVVVAAGGATYRLHTYSSEDFPRLPEVDTARCTRSTATRSSRRSRGSDGARRVTRAARCSPASSSASSPARS